MKERQKSSIPYLLSIDEDEFEKISNETSAKEAWEKLQTS